MNTVACNHHQPILSSLSQGASLLQCLSDGQYRQTVPLAFDSSIGAHYRHAIEHFEALLVAPDEAGLPLIDYDARKRDTAIETERQRALDRTQELIEQFNDKSPPTCENPVLVRCKASSGEAEESLIGSTLGREMVYCIIHAVHHYALIKIMAQIQGIELPQDFGVAPSTLAFQRTRPAAVEVNG